MPWTLSLPFLLLVFLFCFFFRSAIVAIRLGTRIFFSFCVFRSNWIRMCHEQYPGLLLWVNTCRKSYFLYSVNCFIIPRPHNPISSHRKCPKPWGLSTQQSPPDVKPGKDEIVGGGAGNDPINVKVHVLLIYQVDGNTALSPGTFFFAPIQVVAANGEEVFFKIKRTTKHEALQTSGCIREQGRERRQQLQVRSFRCVPPSLIFQRTIFLFFSFLKTLESPASLSG